MSEKTLSDFIEEACGNLYAIHKQSGVDSKPILEAVAAHARKTDPVKAEMERALRMVYRAIEYDYRINPDSICAEEVNKALAACEPERKQKTQNP